MKQKRAIVIGGGSTGCATAHDLALRGLEVILIDRGDIASATTGRCSCYRHTGARYAVTDKESAVECIEENLILQKIMPPKTMEENEGVYVMCADDDPAYGDLFFDACADCGIPAVEMSPKELFAREPNVSRDIRRVALVHDDAVVEPLRFTLAFAATARLNGAKFLKYTEVKEMLFEGNRVTGIRVQDRVTGEAYDIKADIVINAAGPWAGKVAALANSKVTISLSPGLHVILGVRVSHLVIDRMHKPSSGDFIYPLRNQSILGTSSWSVKDCDYLYLPEDHIKQIRELTGAMVPMCKTAPAISINAATRPLLAMPGKSERELSRRFECFDHAVLDNVEGFVTIGGGKMITNRAMAEAISNMVCQKLEIDATCQTRTYPLVSFRRFYSG
jgi:glycerol-3-phosphate dehydrogenase